MDSQPIGTLIWISFRPMLRLVLCGATGFIITKVDLLPPVAARGTGQIALNICLPSLFVSKIIPAFTTENIHNLGPIVLVCLLYQLIGLLTCFLILPFFWVPHRFRWGFLVAGVWGNYGDLPTAVIMSVTASAPFNGTEDQNLAVAYIAAFVLVFMITLFPMGGHYLVAWDFKGPEKEDDEIRRTFSEKAKQCAVTLSRFVHIASSYFPRGHYPSENYSEDVEASKSGMEESNLSTERHLGGWGPEKQHSSHDMIQAAESGPSAAQQRSVKTTSKHATFSDQTDEVITQSETELPSRITSPAPATLVDGTHIVPTETAKPDALRPSFHSTSRFDRLRHQLMNFLRTLLTVPTIAVVTALIISVIQPLKGLFIPLSSSPKAPDGQPPLAFIMDTVTFLGGASVPLGLICLGSALARLKVPRGEWRKMPVGAILALAVGRMVLQPVLGVLIVQGLTHAGLISAEDKVLRFVCFFFSCVPTATTQVYLTQVYSGTGSAEHISAFLIPQYVLMFISSTTLTAYSLHLIFG